MKAPLVAEVPCQVHLLSEIRRAGAPGLCVSTSNEEFQAACRGLQQHTATQDDRSPSDVTASCGVALFV